MIAQPVVHTVPSTVLGEKFGQVHNLQVHSNRLEAARRRQAVETLLVACAGDREHAHHVACLSLRLFDELQDLHHMGPAERRWLEEASLLHDIGAIDGEQGHHKSTLRIILTTPMLPFSSRERLIVGSIARYHRKALPSLEHDHYRALYPVTRSTVSTLAAFLRVAEGLDCDHICLVRDLECRVHSGKVVVHYRSQTGKPVDSRVALDRADLFEQVFSRKLVFRRQVEED